MAAGLGFKTFTTGEVLTAADTNGYLMQGVLVFASAAARNAAITSPQEGQFAYTKDTNGLWYYDGAAWVASGATGDIEGVTAGTGISGGGTSGTVTITNSMATAITTAGDLIKGTGSGTFDRLGIGSTGQVLTVAAGAPSWATPAGGGGMTLLSTTTLSGSSVTVSSISGSYKNLMIVIFDLILSATVEVQMRINGNSNPDYGTACGATSGTSSPANIAVSESASAWTIGKSSSATSARRMMRGQWNIPLYSNTSYNKGLNGLFYASDGTNPYGGYAVGAVNDTGAVTSLTFLPASGTFTSGTVLLYGVS